MLETRLAASLAKGPSSFKDILSVSAVSGEPPTRALSCYQRAGRPACWLFDCPLLHNLHHTCHGPGRFRPSFDKRPRTSLRMRGGKQMPPRRAPNARSVMLHWHASAIYQWFRLSFDHGTEFGLRASMSTPLTMRRLLPVAPPCRQD